MVSQGLPRVQRAGPGGGIGGIGAGPSGAGPGRGKPRTPLKDGVGEWADVAEQASFGTM